MVLVIYFLIVLKFCVIIEAKYFYALSTSYEGTTFFDNFTFFTEDDYTKGIVDYVNRSTAEKLGLISFPNGKVKISTDTTHVYPNTTRGRPSVRIQSLERFNEGLFIFDFDHMPTGPGTWPSFWMYGDDWPNNGELDVLEGIDGLPYNSISGHTGDGCSFPVSDDNLFTGNWAKTFNGNLATNCYSHKDSLASMQGCSIQAANGTFGPAFNQDNGGIYAMEWNRSSYTKVWIFKRSDIPNDITQGMPNPDNWGKSISYFRIGTNCTPDHFNNLTLTINLTFCGLWAGLFYPGGSKACEAVVRNQPSNFTDAYWLINYVKIYEQEIADTSSTSIYGTSSTSIYDTSSTSIYDTSSTSIYGTSSSDNKKFYSPLILLIFSQLLF